MVYSLTKNPTNSVCKDTDQGKNTLQSDCYAELTSASKINMLLLLEIQNEKKPYLIGIQKSTKHLLSGCSLKLLW